MRIMGRAYYKVCLSVIFYVCLMISLVSLPFEQKIVLAEDNWLKVVQTEAGYFINSITPNGNLSFRFEFHGNELSTVAFVNNTGGYAIEYILPVEVWEYEDVDGNGYFDSSYIEWISGKANETVFAYYKNFWFSEITNITTLSDNMGNIVCEWSIKGFAGLSEPWPEEEVLVSIKYTFHYFPLNGSLKTDFGIEKFAARNAASRLFIEFSMRYISTKQEEVKLLMDGETVDVNLTGGHRKINSTTILFVVNGDVKGFFDFGGRCEIGNSTINPIGVIVPWIERGYHVFPSTYNYSTAVGIQLSYPHVDEKMIHDPSFGLKTYNQIIPSQNPPQPNGEPSWKTPLITLTLALAAITITVILKRKRKPPLICP